MNKSEFKPLKYKTKNSSVVLYFHSPKHSFHSFFSHQRKTKTFPYFRNLIDFLDENSGLNIYFTLDDLGAPFLQIDNDLLVNMEEYQLFCNQIGVRTSGRAKAFFGKHLSISQMLTAEQKDEIISQNLTTDIVINAAREMNDIDQQKLINNLSKITPQTRINDEKISINDLVIALKNFAGDPKLQSAANIALPLIQLHTLKDNLSFLQNALSEDKSETDIQNWIDEDNRKYSKQRCMIFGIEFVDPKREGKLSQKRFDVLAEQNRRYHVIIELKGPDANIFEVKQVQNNNGGVSTEYRISEELSRAIPQVLGYKKLYLEMSSEELEAIGLKEQKEISKCVIVIGKRDDSLVWLENFDDLKNSLNGIEIWTYTDMVEKLENTIENLEQNM